MARTMIVIEPMSMQNATSLLCCQRPLVAKRCVLVDRLVYQGLRYATSRHAARDQPVSPHTALPG
jgi:hypothetical protein